MQKGASFNLEAVKEQIQKAAHGEPIENDRRPRRSGRGGPHVVKLRE